MSRRCTPDSKVTALSVCALLLLASSLRAASTNTGFKAAAKAVYGTPCCNSSRTSGRKRRNTPVRTICDGVVFKAGSAKHPECASKPD